LQSISLELLELPYSPQLLVTLLVTPSGLEEHLIGDLWMAPIDTLILAGSLVIASSRALPRWVRLQGSSGRQKAPSASSGSP